MIHKFKLFGQNMVLDVASGALHSVDDTVFELLDCYDENGKFDASKASGDYNEAKAEIDELIAEKMLFTKDVYAPLAEHWDKQSVVKALCLNIAHDCNLRCRYCFAHGGEYMGKRELMSFEVGKAAIDFVIRESKNRKNIEIDYFGGEPLMNFEVVKQITDYAKEQGRLHNKEFRFTITTNGVLLDEDKLAYINENMSNIVLSLDGRKEVHDRVRVRVDGSGSYDAVMPKFRRVAESRNQENYYVRGTFTRDNTDFFEDVRALVDLGFEQISVEPVVAPDSEDYSLRETDLPEIFENYERLAKYLIESRKEDRFFNFFHFMIDLSHGPCAYKLLAGCGSGHEYVAVTPSGDIFPCHQFVSKPEFRMGSVFEGITNTELREKFLKSNMYTKDECKNCWARFFCGGGCAANAYMMNGDINKPHKISCELERKRVECALAIAAILNE